MEKDYLILKRASASRPFGQWDDNDFDVLANRRSRPHLQFSRITGRSIMDVDFDLRVPSRPHAGARLRRDERGRDGSVCQELAAGMRSRKSPA